MNNINKEIIKIFVQISDFTNFNKSRVGKVLSYGFCILEANYYDRGSNIV